VLLIFEDRTGHVEQYTYEAFDRRVNQVARALGRLGLSKGDKFNLHLRNSPEFLFCWLAAAKTGTVMVPTNPDSTAEEMEYILNHSEAKVSIVQGSSASSVLACYFVDRKKDIIKRAGENVSAGEVEEVLKRHPAVFDAAVIGVPDPLRDEAVHALVILQEGARASEEELIAWCRERLTKHKVPEAVEFRTAFPRTSVGKIQKHVLRQEVRTRLAVAKREIGSRH